MRTDTERLDWLERQFGCGLVHDDNEHWAFAAAGIQSVVEGDEPEDLETSFYVEKDKFRSTVREAIDAAMEGQSNKAIDKSDTAEYAKVIWVVGDVKAIRPSWSMEKCEEELSSIERQLEEGMIMAGWQVLEGCLPGEE